MPNTIEELARMLAKRDGITYNEEMNVISMCIDDIHEAIGRGRYFEAEDILHDYLGLEPDYLEILIL